MSVFHREPAPPARHVPSFGFSSGEPLNHSKLSSSLAASSNLECSAGRSMNFCVSYFHSPYKWLSHGALPPRSLKFLNFLTPKYFSWYLDAKSRPKKGLILAPGNNFKTSMGTVFELREGKGVEIRPNFFWFVEFMYLLGSYRYLYMLSTSVPTYFYMQPQRRFLKLSSRRTERLNRFLAIFYGKLMIFRDLNCLFSIHE